MLKREARRVRERFLEQRGTVWNKNTGPSQTPAPLSSSRGRTRLLAKRAACPPCRENAAPAPRELGKHPGFPREAEAPGTDGLFRAGDECASWGRGEREGPGPQKERVSGGRRGVCSAVTRGRGRGSRSPPPRCFSVPSKATRGS